MYTHHSTENTQERYIAPEGTFNPAHSLSQSQMIPSHMLTSVLPANLVQINNQYLPPMEIPTLCPYNEEEMKALWTSMCQILKSVKSGTAKLLAFFLVKWAGTEEPGQIVDCIKKVQHYIFREDTTDCLKKTISKTNVRSTDHRHKILSLLLTDSVALETVVNTTLAHSIVRWGLYTCNSSYVALVENDPEIEKLLNQTKFADLQSRFKGDKERKLANSNDSAPSYPSIVPVSFFNQSSKKRTYDVSFENTEASCKRQCIDLTEETALTTQVPSKADSQEIDDVWQDLLSDAHEITTHADSVPQNSIYNSYPPLEVNFQGEEQGFFDDESYTAFFPNV